jgi:ribosomal protein L17
VHDHPWIDNEMRFLLKKKDTQRRIVNKVRSQSAKKKYDDLRRAAKQLLAKKRQEHVHKLKESVATNPKRFGGYIKSCTSINRSCNFI